MRYIFKITENILQTITYMLYLNNFSLQASQKIENFFNCTSATL